MEYATANVIRYYHFHKRKRKYRNFIKCYVFNTFVMYI